MELQTDLGHTITIEPFQGHLDKPHIALRISRRSIGSLASVLLKPHEADQLAFLLNAAVSDLHEQSLQEASR